jgi:predicted  nucleic acid-binding Zn-ribbon protein
MKKRRSKKPNLLKEARIAIADLKQGRAYLQADLQRLNQQAERARDMITCGTYADKGRTLEQMVVWLVTEYKSMQARCNEMQTAINSMKDITSRHTGNWPEPYRTETTTSA